MQKKLGNFDVFRETADLLDGDGALLVAGAPPNLMTIGWGTIGPLWGRDVFQVFVRPTRYTFTLMEKTMDFSVCFLPPEFSKALALCGTQSGKTVDKIALSGLTLTEGITILTPYVRESVFHYECRLIHKHRVDPGTLDADIIRRYYPQKDFHMVYYGEILGVFKH